jgi:putative membrane protein
VCLVIVKEPIPWIRLVLAIHHSALPKTLPRTLAFTAFAALVTWLEMLAGYDAFTLTIGPFTLIGAAISIFLAFRTNVAYDRYWEGRKLWGALVNVSRTFARQTTTLIDSGSAEQNRLIARELVHRTIAFAYALKHQLRHTEPWDDIAKYVTLEEAQRLRAQRNIPLGVSRLLGERLSHAWRQGWIRDIHMPVFEKCLTEMTTIQGGCERIDLTPVPFAYTTLIHRIVGFYCLLLPFGIVNDVRWMTPLVELMICHAFFGLDEIGDEIEEPFGTEPQDLPLAAISRTIEINLLQYLDEGDVPEPLRPVGRVLS